MSSRRGPASSVQSTPEYSNTPRPLQIPFEMDCLDKEIFAIEDLTSRLTPLVVQEPPASGELAPAGHPPVAPLAHQLQLFRARLVKVREIIDRLEI